jgi:hypothetical protein
MVMTRKVGNQGKKSNVKQNAFCQFCSETSLPGWSYLNREANKVWMTIWIILLITAAAMSFYFLVINLHCQCETLTFSWFKNSGLKKFKSKP